MTALPARKVEIEHQQLYTAEEFMTLALDPGKRYELVKGIIKEMSHPGREHMRVSSRLMLVLGNYTQANNLGEVLTPGGFKLNIPSSKGGTVRSPDLTFLVNEKLAGPPGAITDVPDLAIEVYSPNDEPGELRKKLADYQQSGWNLVWVIYPPLSSPKRKAGTIEVYRLQEETGHKPALTLGPKDILRGDGILEGFHIEVAALFK